MRSDRFDHEILFYQIMHDKHELIPLTTQRNPSFVNFSCRAGFLHPFIRRSLHHKPSGPYLNGTSQWPCLFWNGVWCEWDVMYLVGINVVYIWILLWQFDKRTLYSTNSLYLSWNWCSSTSQIKPILSNLPLRIGSVQRNLCLLTHFPSTLLVGTLRCPFTRFNYVAQLAE